MHTLSDIRPTVKMYDKRKRNTKEWTKIEYNVKTIAVLHMPGSAENIEFATLRHTQRAIVGTDDIVAMRTVI